MKHVFFCSGVCRCREGCVFLKDPIGCQKLHSIDVCPTNQNVEDSGNGFGKCECIEAAIPMKDFKGCSYPHSQGPCPDGQEVQEDRKLGVCVVILLDIYSKKLLQYLYYVTLVSGKMFKGWISRNLCTKKSICFGAVRIRSI